MFAFYIQMLQLANFYYVNGNEMECFSDIDAVIRKVPAVHKTDTVSKNTNAFFRGHSCFTAVLDELSLFAL